MDEQKQDVGEPDYDKMTEEEYMHAMELKVEHYKKLFPDMYEKAVQWLEMLNHSEVYKQNSGDSSGPSEQSEGYLNAMDMLKNMNYHGITEEELSDAERTNLDTNIPDWKTKLTSL